MAPNLLNEQEIKECLVCIGVRFVPHTACGMDTRNPRIPPPTKSPSHGPSRGTPQTPPHTPRHDVCEGPKQKIGLLVPGIACGPGMGRAAKTVLLDREPKITGRDAVGACVFP